MVKSIFRYCVPESWYRNVYRDKAEPLSAARSFTLAHSSRPDKCILLIHGYTGYPGEMVRPARELYEAGYDVYVPRLPGHGTSGKDFSKSRKKDWLGVADAAVDDLRKRYRDVYIAGHSMGGAIAAIEAAKHSISRVCLIAPAVIPGDEKLPIRRSRFISFFVRKKSMPWESDPGYVMYYENAPCDDEALGKEYWSWLYLLQTHDLLCLAREAYDTCRTLKSDALIVTAGNDAIVKKSYTDKFIAELCCSYKSVEVENATHYILYDKDKKAEEEAVESIVSWFSA